MIKWLIQLADISAIQHSCNYEIYERGGTFHVTHTVTIMTIVALFIQHRNYCAQGARDGLDAHSSASPYAVRPHILLHNNSHIAHTTVA